MWVCHLCSQKTSAVSCCGKEKCENSRARFPNIQDFWNHLERSHKAVYDELTKCEQTKIV